MSQGRVSSSCGSQQVICRGRTGVAFSLPLIMTRLSGANCISLVFDLRIPPGNIAFISGNTVTLMSYSTLFRCKMRVSFKQNK